MYNNGDKVMIKDSIEGSRLGGLEVVIRNKDHQASGAIYMVEMKDPALLGGIEKGGCWFWIEEEKLVPANEEKEDI